MKKIILFSFVLIVFNQIDAVTVINNSKQSITLSNFTFISGKEIWRKSVTVRPGKTFNDSDIASFSLTIEACAHRQRIITQHYQNLQAETVIELKQEDQKVCLP